MYAKQCYTVLYIAFVCMCVLLFNGLSWFKAHSPRQGAGREWGTHGGGGVTLDRTHGGRETGQDKPRTNNMKQE